MTSLKFCLLSADYILDEQERPVMRLWGRTSSGKSVLCIDRGFSPYFYVEPREGMSLDELQGIAKRIGNLVLEEEGKESRRPLRVEMLEMRYLGVSRKVFRVYVQTPADVPKFRDLLKDWSDVKEEYEYAVSFYKRYMIDNRLVPMGWVEAEGSRVETECLVDTAFEAERVKPLEEEDIPPLRLLAFDIETSEREGEKVIMLSMCDNKGFDRVLTYRGRRRKGVEVLRDEAALIRRFMALVRERDPDMVLGYNTDRFDFVKLDSRATALGIDLDLSRDGTKIEFRRRVGVSSAKAIGRVHIDLFGFVENIMQFYLSTEVLSLERVAQEIVGRRKKDMKWREIEESWRDGKDLRKLADYCLWDSRLALMLGESVLPQVYELSRVCGQLPFDVARMRYSQLVEWLLMRRAHEAGELSPNRPRYDEIMRRRKYPAYTGGYVHPPKEGIHEKIALYDFTSLYPSITITHNVSPETLDCMCCPKDSNPKTNHVPEGEHYFCQNHKGFIPAILEGLVEQRQSIKRRMRKAKKGTKLRRMLDNRQNALKILANASYGYYAYAGSRWYSRVCAQSITAWGRHYIKQVISKAQSMGFSVIYGDTDSLFIESKTRKAARDFLKRANKDLPGVMELELEGMYKAGIFVLAKSGKAAKKRYALIDSRGKMTIRGFEKVRRDWSPIAKQTQESVLEAVLRNRSPEKALGIVKKSIERIRNHQVELDDLVIYSQITRPLSQYEQIGPHVAAARRAREKGRIIRPGMSISIIIEPGEGSISSRAVPLEDARDYDPDYYISNQLIPAALRVLSGLGYTEDDLLGRGSQSSLEGFLGK